MRGVRRIVSDPTPDEYVLCVHPATYPVDPDTIRRMIEAQQNLGGSRPVIGDVVWVDPRIARGQVYLTTLRDLLRNRYQDFTLFEDEP